MKTKHSPFDCPFHRPFHSTRRAFTLIELLVTMAIIAILAAILVPMASSMIATAKRNKARGETSSIAMAVQNYQSSYARMPMPGNGGGAMTAKDIVKVLIGEDPVRNPRKTVYLSLQTSDLDGTFLDPWGTQYEIHQDHDADGQIVYPAGTVYKSSAIAVSKGPNRGGPAGDTDDITSVP